METVAAERRVRRRWLPFRLRLPVPGMSVRALLPFAGPKPLASQQVEIYSPYATAAPDRMLVSSHASAAAAVAAGGGGSGGGALMAAPPHASVTAAMAAAPASGAAVQGAAASATTAKVAAKPVSDVLAGALARAASQSTIHPLDTLKVRMQAAARSSTGQASSSLSKFGRLVPPMGGSAAGGARPPAAAPDLRVTAASIASLYKGVVGAASGAGIAIGAYFACYSASCNLLAAHTTLNASGVAFVGGAAAAAGSSVVKVPLAVCIRSVQAGVYPNVFTAASSIIAAAGPRGLFTGFLPTLLEDVPDMAIKFAAYESMRSLHQRLNGGRPAGPQEDFAMGAIAGAAAAAATTPLDVVKTRMMCAAATRPTMRGAAAAVLAQGGLPGFFTGVGARSLSNGINSAVFFCFFEAIRGAFAARAAEQQLLASGAAPAELSRRASALRAHGQLLGACDGSDDADGSGGTTDALQLLRVEALQLDSDDALGGAGRKPTLLITLRPLRGARGSCSASLSEE